MSDDDYKDPFLNDDDKKDDELPEDVVDALDAEPIEVAGDDDEDEADDLLWDTDEEE